MSSTGGGPSLTQRNYRLASNTDKPRTTGVVNDRLLSDYLHHVFPSCKPGLAPPSLRKPLGFQDLGAHLETLLCEGEPAEDSRDQPVDGRLGPQPVVLDHTSGFEGLLFVDDDLLGVIGHSNFSSIRATTCVFTGKWAYEVLISSQGLMQIGWCTLNCRFNQEEGVGDTPDSYAYDGNRVRKWNVTTTNYGKSWAAGDIVSCLMDLEEGTIMFCLNGQSLGTAFTNIKTGPGVAYFPAISLSFKESLKGGGGSAPHRWTRQSVPIQMSGGPLSLTLLWLRYPVEGYLPLQDPPTADLLKAHRLLGYIKNVMSTSIDTQEDRLLDKDCALWRLQGEATVLITLAHIFNYFAPLMRRWSLEEVAKWPLEEVARWPLEEVARWPLEEVARWPLEEVARAFRGGGQVAIRGSGQVAFRGSGQVAFRGEEVAKWPLEEVARWPLEEVAFRGVAKWPLEEVARWPLEEVVFRGSGQVAFRGGGQVAIRGSGQVAFRGGGQVAIRGSGQVAFRGSGQCKVYLVEDVLMNFLLGILEGGGSVDEHPLIQHLLDLFWLLMEDYEVNECLKQLMMALLRAYRFSPIIPDLGFQVPSLISSHRFCWPRIMLKSRLL
ncbi:E3 ubiquitin-protein ligase RNF123 [Takifugu flavidus]|uniref:E3 ubiquitin-protein ligase RNF123 n=1 Tax=Takifugu flavidus TaxID=433684 RepID=A0A5C6N1C9_9TELE|nr:E3 ubiquitin-protein ligase RNF123 [Takifugu flavidus]